MAVGKTTARVKWSIYKLDVWRDNFRLGWTNVHGRTLAAVGYTVPMPPTSENDSHYNCFLPPYFGVILPRTVEN